MNIKDVENLAELARLEIPDEEKEQILKDMEGILAYVKQIEGVKLPAEGKGVRISKENPHNVWREDTETPRDFSTKLITDQFPDSQDGFLKVKKIL